MSCPCASGAPNSTGAAATRDDTSLEAPAKALLKYFSKSHFTLPSPFLQSDSKGWAEPHGAKAAPKGSAGQGDPQDPTHHRQPRRPAPSSTSTFPTLILWTKGFLAHRSSTSFN